MNAPASAAPTARSDDVPVAFEESAPLIPPKVGINPATGATKPPFDALICPDEAMSDPADCRHRPRWFFRLPLDGLASCYPAQEAHGPRLHHYPAADLAI